MLRTRSLVTILLVTISCATMIATATPVPPPTPAWYSICSLEGRRSDDPLLTGSPIIRPSVSNFPYPVGPTPAEGAWLQVTVGLNTSCVGWGYYNDNIDTTGWGYLHIETNTQESFGYGQIEQYYVAGLLEGYLLSGANFSGPQQPALNRIYQSKLNNFPAAFDGNSTIPDSVLDFISIQNEWIAYQLGQNPTSVYWQTVSYQYYQMQGIADAYSNFGPMSQQPVYIEDILTLNALGEVSDMMASRDLQYRDSIDVLKMHDFVKVRETLEKNSHCSALIRIAPDGSDLYSAHTTWTEYATMLRTYKYYQIGGTNSQHFSSYPACISSIDDYYQTGADMIVIETTNNVANMSLYDLTTADSVPTFVRVVVANQLTSSGKSWAAMYAQYNSGTYNNQWMIVDNKRFMEGRAQSGTLYIATQIPGRVESTDATNVLTEQGYWASYNIPYFPDLWTELGYGELVQQYGTWGTYMWTYHQSFRALMFARDAPNVSSLEDMQQIIQQNKYQTDPLSKGSAELAIAARADLSSGPFSPIAAARGAVDAKLSSKTLMASGSWIVYAKSGPTIESQAPFVWSTSPWASTSHVGLPDEFNFDWQTFSVTPAVPPTKQPVVEQPQIMTE